MSHDPLSVAGIVVAGGRSTRFGSEKAVASFAGRSLLEHAVARLRGSCAAVAVNARPGSEAEALATRSGLPVLHDAPGDPDGPLSGVKAGLAWARSRGARALAVSPCDAPLLPADLFPRLLEAAGAGAAFAVTSEGRQPLCAVWPVAALDAVTAALAGGAHPPTWRLLGEIGAVSVTFPDAAAFANLNTRDDLARMEGVFTSGTGPR